MRFDIAQLKSPVHGPTLVPPEPRAVPRGQKPEVIKLARVIVVCVRISVSAAIHGPTCASHRRLLAGMLLPFMQV